jgi:hypothetical protein
MGVLEPGDHLEGGIGAKHIDIRNPALPQLWVVKNTASMPSVDMSDLLFD